MRKSVMFAVAALMIAAGCSESVWTGSEQKAADLEITFDNPIVSPSTRAVTALSPNESFKVYAKKYFEEFTSWADAVDYIYTEEPTTGVKKGVQVSFYSGLTQSDGAWRSDQKFYWPKDGGKLVFIAHAPADLLNYNYPGLQGNSVTNPEFTETGIVLNNFWAIKNSADFLYSDPVTNQTASVPDDGGSVQSVQITFNHALALLSMNVRLLTGLQQGSEVIVNSAEFNFFDNATFNQNISSGIPSWTEPENSSTYPLYDDKYSDQQVVLTSTQNVSLGTVTVIPQAVEKVSLFIRYTVYDEPGSNGEQFHRVLNLSDCFPAEQQMLEMGKHYIFNIVIDVVREEITFEPSVTQWETVEQEVQIAPAM